MLEIRTAAGPSSAAQWLLSAGPGPKIVVSHARQLQVVCPAVPEAGLMTRQDLVGAEGVAVGAVRGWVIDPLPGRGLHELAQHP